LPTAPCSFPSVGKAVPEGSTVLAVDVDVDDEIARRRRRAAVTVLFGEANKFSHPFVGLDDDDELQTILISCVELLLGSQDKISHPLAGVMSVMAYGSPHFFFKKNEKTSREYFFFLQDGSTYDFERSRNSSSIRRPGIGIEIIRARAIETRFRPVVFGFDGLDGGGG